MQIKKLTKDQLIHSIETFENLLENKVRIRTFKNWTIGAFVNHLSKLKQELKTRG